MGCVSCGGACYAPIGLCERCRRRVRDAARELVAVLHCLASDEVLDLLGRLAHHAATLHDGEAARFVESTALYAGDGWPLSSEVH